MESCLLPYFKAPCSFSNNALFIIEQTAFVKTAFFSQLQSSAVPPSKVLMSKCHPYSADHHATDIRNKEINFSAKIFGIQESCYSFNSFSAGLVLKYKACLLYLPSGVTETKKFVKHHKTIILISKLISQNGVNKQP